MPKTGCSANKASPAPTRRTLLSGIAMGALAPLAHAANPSRGVDHLYGQPIFSESVRLDALTSDAKTGFFLRLCRYPTANTTRAWAHVFTPEAIYSFNDHFLPCAPDKTELGSDHVVYRLPDSAGPELAIRLERDGSREAPAECRAKARFLAREGDRAPHGLGEIPVTIDARLQPRRHFAGMRQDRTAIQGDVETEMTIGGVSVPLASFGQFHEQPRTNPRWVSSFTYASLWGEELSLTASMTPQGTRGFVFRDDRAVNISDLLISEPASERRLRLELEDGDVLEGRCERRHEYFIPMFDWLWRGTKVTVRLAGSPLWGSINDWKFEEQPYRL
ncbi:MAG: hypothetical protein OXN96_09805 [Bryobacterales bacterium]|nr:hypothetical protein [Bryobacterales bacterium]